MKCPICRYGKLVWVEDKTSVYAIYEYDNTPHISDIVLTPLCSINSFLTCTRCQSSDRTEIALKSLREKMGYEVSHGTQLT